MLINLSNHPYDQWDENQKNESQSFGKCIDMPFPVVDPEGDLNYITDIANDYYNKLVRFIDKTNEEVVVHLMGEMTFLYTLLVMLRKNGIRCIASTTDRVSTELDSGEKLTQFKFVRFRDYYLV